MEDVEIIDLFFARSERAITELAGKYGRMCRQVAYNLLGNLEDAEECVNDTYMGAWDTIPPQRPNPLATYVCKITRNIALKKCRHDNAKRRGRHYEISLSELEECIPSDRWNPQKETASELTEAIEGFLDTLDKKSRVIFVKRYWYAEPVKEIAEQVGISENHVSVRLSRTRNKLRTYLQGKGVAI
ncbi:MAG: sigma-70 family RNA polymerase sigma factor [Clostridiales bacterium]|nr:sigma-70 family RNA polymerase sigma factor [Clostridiales bacterium]